MTLVTATVFDECTCGRTIALLPSAAGNLYPVEIRQGVKQDARGNKTAVVTKNDFHYCAMYPGLATFIASAIERSDARRIRIRLLTARNRPVVLSWSAGKRAVNVTDGGPYGDAAFYGTVDLEHGGFRQRDDQLDGLDELLEALDNHPAQAARAYGQATGQCCFCDLPLDDERSINAGYGPVCAKRFGLMWGEEGENSKRRAKRTAKAIELK